MVSASDNVFLDAFDSNKVTHSGTGHLDHAIAKEKYT